MAEREPTDDSKRSVLGRAFDILDCFAGGSELVFASICEQTKLPPATVHRMLAALVEWGGVERLSHGRYRLGARIWRLGIGAPQVRRLRDIAQPHLIELHMATRGTVYLGVRDGDDAVFADRVTRVRPTAGSSRATKRMPLHRTGGGCVLLAHSDDAWKQLTEQAEHDEVLAAQLPQVEQFLDEIRETGLAISRNDGFPGRTSVSAPIFDEEGGVIASLSVAFPDTRIPDPRSIVPQVLAVAKALSADLARHPGSRIDTDLTSAH